MAIDAEIEAENIAERKKDIERRCEDTDDGITAEERRCIFCGHGTLIDETCADWGDIPEECRVHDWYVRCPSCGARGPMRGTKKEAVDAWRSRAREGG